MEDQTTLTLHQFRELYKDKGAFHNDDIVALFLPLFKSLNDLYELNKVANVRQLTNLNVTNFKFEIDYVKVSDPVTNFEALKRVKKRESNVFEISEELIENIDVGSGDLDIKSNNISFLDEDDTENSETITPKYYLGYKTYEQALNHYDQKTELFICGLLMASFAFNLDFNEKEDLKTFVNNRNQLYYLNSDIHPTLLQIIRELTRLDREKRIRDTKTLIWKLENYKEYNADFEEDLTQIEGFKKQSLSTRKNWVLQRLKSWLFDLTRRNKLLYYKPTSNFLNLTIASVPTVLYYENVNEKNLFLWHDDISSKVKSQGKIRLDKYLNFDEAGYIASNLDKIRTEARKDIYEYGFSQLKLVLTFLNWYNFKENKNEKITSPLLILPVEVKKQKSIKDNFVLEINSSQAEVNPVLVHYLKELYDIELPDYIDLEKVSPLEFYEHVKQTLAKAKQGITLHLIDKPRIKLIQAVAKQKITQYKKRNRYRTHDFNVSNYNYSYSRDQYVPLGAQIHNSLIKERMSYLEYLINDDISTEQRTNFSDTKTRTMYSIESVSSDRNPYVWEFDMCNITIGNFNYKKMSLVRDYNTILQANNDNAVFDQLFSDAPKALEDSNEQLSNYEDNFYILNADATQGKAVSKAKTGKNIIIQGPPGTGKSQTITNLIADFAKRNKRVLFVCEKRAALDVVYARLKQRNIHHLASLIHDSQTDKKEFVMNVKDTYNKFIEDEDNFKTLEKERKQKLEQLKTELEHIANYHHVLKTAFTDVGMRLFEFVEHNIYLNQKHNNKATSPSNVSYAIWQDSLSTLTDLSDALEQLGYNSNPSSYSLKVLSPKVLNNEDPISFLKTNISTITETVDEFQEFSEFYDLPELLEFQVLKLQTLAKYASIVNTLKTNDKDGILTPKSDDAKTFNSILKDIEALDKKLETAKDTNSNWKDKLPLSEAKSALETAKRLEGNFFKFLFSSYNKTKKVVKSSYNFSAHKIEPKISEVLENLIHEYNIENDIKDKYSDISTSYGIEDINLEHETIEILRKDEENRTFLMSKSSETLEKLNELKSEIHNLLNASETIGINTTQNVETIGKLVNALQSDLKTLPVTLPYLRAFNKLPEQLKNTIKTDEKSLDDHEYNIAKNTLTKLYNENIKVVNATGYGLTYAIETIKKIHNELLKLNSEFLVAQYRNTFKSQLHNSTLLAKQQSEQDKIDKKIFNKSRRVLENEFKKSIRYKSIRELKSIESSYILDMIKPIWLMSPLSVSDTLPVDTNLFDVVIFDEASQITLEEGVPTLFRGKQAIIVGDEMQMPPTNFFSTSTAFKEELDDDEDDVKISIEADSMLTHASRKLESVMLSWHYRSRYEGLIGFSNNAFYQNELLTIPDKEILDTKSDEDDTQLIVNRLQNDCITFHFQENGVYSKRKNNVEADYIAQMVKELLTQTPEHSIGIVAFSKEQQENIENAIDKLVENDSHFAQLLEQAFTREEDGQQIGLFVKNLENVQGDERDIIIISVCYGYDERNKMRMNFGPINRKGGEKRLNVIFSRAKKHMAIVSSIKYNDITNEYNEGANYLRLFLQYAESVSNSDTILSETILKKLNPEQEQTQQATKNAVIKEITDYITALGYDYRLNVGLSNFKISIGVIDNDKNTFALGIIVDSEAFYNSTAILDNYVLKPNLLSVFGWKNMLVFTKDWFDDANIIKQQIKYYLENNEPLEIETKQEEMSLEEASKEDTIVTDSNETSVNDTTETIENKDKKETSKTSNTEKTYLEFKSETSNKFWSIYQTETMLTISFGKIGTNGRELTKTFETPETAKAEMEKLIGEKRKKGYK